jgi:hypothetical protein
MAMLNVNSRSDSLMICHEKNTIAGIFNCLLA